MVYQIMSKREKAYIAILVSIFCSSVIARADTIYMKDGQEKKGIVVENYHDRIVLSTVDGEKEIKKEDIKDILYDRRQQNLVKLGDFHEQRGNLMKAYTYYKKAHQLDPDYKEAQDKFIHIRSILLRRPEKQLREDISRRQTLFKESGRPYEPKITEGVPNTVEDRLKNTTGLVLVSDNEMPKVDMVLDDSPAQKAGIQREDFIYSVWGKLTGYMDLYTICNMMVESVSPETTLAIKRNIVIMFDPDIDRRYGGVGRIGFSLDMTEEGLTITDVKAGSIAAGQGLAKDDLITAIEGKSTRYMPLKDAVRYIDESCSKGRVELEVIREATLWRKVK